MKGLKKSFILLGLILFNSMAFAMPYNSTAKINPVIQNKYHKFEVESSDVLTAQGDDYYSRQKKDSALICFSIVANRYKENMNRENKTLCARAYYRCGSIYLYRFNDYAMALQNMQTALSIAQETDNHALMASIYIIMGNIYVFYADQHKSDDMMRTGFGMYRQAMRLSVEEKQWSNLLMAYINITSSTLEYAEMLDIYQDVDYFRSLEIDPKTPLLTYANAMTDGLLLMRSCQYNDAIDAFSASSEEVVGIDNPGMLFRYQFPAECHVSECYMLLGEFDKALDVLLELEQRADHLHLTDLMPETFSRLEALYNKSGNTAMEQFYHLKYLEIKDSLTHSVGLEGVKDMHFLYELNKLNDQLAESAYHRERQKMMIFGGGFVLLAVVIFLIVIYRKNRKLNFHNKILYQRMQEVLKTSAPSPTIAAETSDNIADNLPKKNAATPMSEQQKSALSSKLLEILSDPGVLCSADLTEQSLAQQLDSNSSYLSKVVNELFHCNFKTLVNDLRVREACRRIGDEEHYGQYSIEGIGTSVGFNSRSAFYTAFKRVTGLTPSEYKRESLKNRLDL